MSQSPGDSRYAINEASIVADVLEGEVVLVNLDSGAYYILQDTASVIWQMLAAGQSVPEVATALSQYYAGDRPALESAVADFLGQLLQETLLVPAAGRAELPVAADVDLVAGERRAFAAPVMYRYTDMQALIQMDPIREYDETGWPRRPMPPPRTE